MEKRLSNVKEIKKKKKKTLYDFLFYMNMKQQQKMLKVSGYPNSPLLSRQMSAVRLN